MFASVTLLRIFRTTLALVFLSAVVVRGDLSADDSSLLDVGRIVGVRHIEAGTSFRIGRPLGPFHTSLSYFRNERRKLPVQGIHDGETDTPTANGKHTCLSHRGGEARAFS